MARRTPIEALGRAVLTAVATAGARGAADNARRCIEQRQAAERAADAAAARLAPPAPDRVRSAA